MPCSSLFSIPGPADLSACQAAKDHRDMPVINSYYPKLFSDHCQATRATRQSASTGRLQLQREIAKLGQSSCMES
jgi:hypothetical protein